MQVLVISASYQCYLITLLYIWKSRSEVLALFAFSKLKKLIANIELFQFSEEKMYLVLREVPFESLIRHLEKSDERVILNVLTLMNSLYNKARDDERNIIIEVNFWEKYLHKGYWVCFIHLSLT